MKPSSKNVFLAFVVFVVLLVFIFVCTTLFLRWTRNPYGLEEERLGPKGDEALPPILAISNAKNYILYPYPQQNHNAYVIHLALPNDYIHSSNYTDRILKSYGVSASMYFPGLNGKFHPDNANLPNCNGYCGGYIRASIERKQSDVHAMNMRQMAEIAEKKLKGKPYYESEDLAPEFGIDEHFQIRRPVLDARSKDDNHLTEEYLIKRNRNGKLEYLFECSPYAPSPNCEVSFNLSSMPELMVNIIFGRHLMPEWQTIIQSVNSKIASWGPVRIETVRK